MLYAAIAEKTGWSPAVISSLNLDTVSALIEGWNRLATGEVPAAPSSVQDILQFKAIADSAK